MKYYWTLLLFIVGIFGCKDSGPKVFAISFGSFVIETPETWRSFKQQGVDSEIGGVVTNHGDSLFYEIGYYTNDLHEPDPVLMDSSQYRISIYKPGSDDGVVILPSTKFVDPDRYRTTCFFYESLGKYRAKFVRPVNPGVGAIGVYIDSFATWNGSVVRFSIYGKNIASVHEEEVLKAFKSIAF